MTGMFGGGWMERSGVSDNESLFVSCFPLTGHSARQVRDQRLDALD